MLMCFCMLFILSHSPAKLPSTVYRKVAIISGFGGRGPSSLRGEIHGVCPLINTPRPRVSRECAAAQSLSPPSPSHIRI